MQHFNWILKFRLTDFIFSWKWYPPLDWFLLTAFFSDLCNEKKSIKAPNKITFIPSTSFQIDKNSCICTFYTSVSFVFFDRNKSIIPNFYQTNWWMKSIEHCQRQTNVIQNIPKIISIIRKTRIKTKPKKHNMIKQVHKFLYDKIYMKSDLTTRRWRKLFCQKTCDTPTVSNLRSLRRW